MIGGMPPTQTFTEPLHRRIAAALPQTQCTRCGFPDCAAYAQAIAEGQADINQCPPGGAEGVERLSALTGRPVLPLNPEHGAEGPRSVAWIDENWCIGCTLCLDACPTDAIVGTNKRMHTVLEPHCTGCELCLPVCPVDCILLENASGTATGWNAWSTTQAQHAQERYQARLARQAATAAMTGSAPEAPIEPTTAAVSTPALSGQGADAGRVASASALVSSHPAPADARAAVIAAALEKARQQRAQRQSS